MTCIPLWGVVVWLGVGLLGAQTLAAQDSKPNPPKRAEARLIDLQADLLAEALESHDKDHHVQPWFAGVGVAAATVGTLMSRLGFDLSLAPTPNGAMLLGRF